MRLLKFLTEAKDVDKSILDNCQPFLKEGKSLNNYKKTPLWRGSNDVVATAKLYKTNKNRMPVDTPEKIHHGANDILKKTVGKPLRSMTMFCTTNDHVAKSYGQPYCVLPVDKFTLYSNATVEDLTISMFNDISGNPDKILNGYKKLGIYLKDIVKKHKVQMPEGHILEQLFDAEDLIANNSFGVFDEKKFAMYKPVAEEIKNQMASIVARTRKVSLKEAVDGKHEVMVDCDAYYLAADKVLMEGLQQ